MLIYAANDAAHVLTGYNRTMDKPKVTPKDFFLWVGAMFALYGSVIALISLLFDYINYAFPDVLNGYIDPYAADIRYEVASLIVLFPVLLVLMRLIRKGIARDESKKDLWVRRWALYLTVFIAGVTIVGDVITLLYYFLGGEITTRFILKVLVVFLVAGGGFLHFLADIWGYWILFPKRAQSVGYAVGALILATVVAGFLIIGSPSQIRMYRLDDRKVSDLSNLQSQIVDYWRQKERLPQTFDVLRDSIGGSYIPVDPQTGEPYEYRTTGALSFELCANFNMESREDVNGRPSSPRMITAVEKPGMIEVSDNWKHAAGRHCYQRTIDPDRYPPYRAKPAL